MNLIEISNLRLLNQQIIVSKFTTAREIVSWMGAVQAQDYNMSKWAIGLRLPGSTDKMIESAIDDGDILRTHVLRPTWHFVSPEDIYWMIELSAKKIISSMKSRDKQLGLTEKIYKKSNTIIEKALSSSRHLTREEIITEFVRANIAVDQNRASHLLFRAETEGIICSGKTRTNKYTYALLHDRVSKTRSLKRDEAIAELAKRYFTSHGPATMQDFTWWSGLTAGESRQAMEVIKSDFLFETIDDLTYWFSPSTSVSKIEKDLLYFLPAYDEFIISYKNRTASLPYESHNKAVSNNGVFRPLIVKDRHVIGIWKRTINKENVILETSFFKPFKSVTKKMIMNSTVSYGHFLEKEILTTKVLYG